MPPMEVGGRPEFTRMSMGEYAAVSMRAAFSSRLVAASTVEDLYSVLFQLILHYAKNINKDWAYSLYR